jgi:hypothetical protein
MEYRLDMSMMFAMHDALRRELVQVAGVASRRDDNPGTLLRAALGWELFTINADLAPFLVSEIYRFTCQRTREGGASPARPALPPGRRTRPPH